MKNKGIIIALFALLILPAIPGAPVFAAEDQCLTCHMEQDDELGQPAKLFKDDIHEEAGLTCASCHGGDSSTDDPDIAMSEEKGFVGVPEHDEVPRFCAKCHSDANFMKQYNPGLPVDQYQKYKTSVHGKKLVKGDENVANCISCHSVHDIRKANNPKSTIYAVNLPATCAKCHGDAEYMKDYSIPTDQFELYKQSVHGIALLERKDTGAPACNDCHGNHGATPPGISSISNVCQQCHVINGEMFAKSPHMDAFAEMELPQCETCHSNHKIEKPTDDKIGIGDNSLCIDCHSEDDGNDGWSAAKQMHEKIDSLRIQYEFAKKLLDEADQKGMEISDARFDLKDAYTALLQTRSEIHTFNLPKVLAKADEGLKIANKTIEEGYEAHDQYDFRRTGLGFATLLITLVVVGLYLKIKDIEKKQKS